MRKKLINIAMIVSIIFNIWTIILPNRNLQLPPAIDIFLVRMKLCYFFITAFFIIPVLVRNKDKKGEILIEIWGITIIMLIVKVIIDFFRSMSWR